MTASGGLCLPMPALTPMPNPDTNPPWQAAPQQCLPAPGMPGIPGASRPPSQGPAGLGPRLKTYGPTDHTNVGQ